jgi:hypothetical protein
VAGLFFRSAYTADNAVNSDKGVLNCRHEQHALNPENFFHVVFDLLSLSRQISVLSQSLFLLYPLLHFVPNKKAHKMLYSLFISIFKVFYHLIFIARAVIFLRGR